ncbi:hypothetical protein BKA69DRAFT_911001 [Paraphysoderma sedebokerense]|nr:hypothetical protein BKA69DRAFT_911001 [Paraphysoderma sedebokerense]
MAAPSTQPSTRINSTLISSLFQSRQLWLTANFQKSSVSPSTLAHPSAPHQSNITGPESIGTNRDSPNHQIKTTYLGEADVTIGPHIFSGTKFWSVDLSTASSKMIEDSSVRISRNDESGIKKEEIIFQFRENKETPFIWPEISLFELNDAQKNTPFYNVDSGAGIKDTQENEHDLIVYCFLPGPPPSSTASSITQSTLDSTSSFNDAGTSHSPRRSKDRRNEDGEVVLVHLNGVGQLFL